MAASQKCPDIFGGCPPLPMLRHFGIPVGIALTRLVKEEMKIKFASSRISPKSDKESLLQFFNISLRS